jgi:CBS domain-containing protein
LPIGIITDKDLRLLRESLAQRYRGPQIMPSPVITVPATIRIEVQIAMMQHNIGHLNVTSDGAPTSEIIDYI